MRVHGAAGRPADRAGDRPRRRPGPQARQPVPADRPVRRHPPRFARARACTTPTRGCSRARCCASAASGRSCSRARWAATTAAPIQLDEPDRGPQPGHEGPPARRPRRADDRDLPRPADRRRRARGAVRDRQPRGARRRRSRSSSSWAPTTPTSSRSAAIRGRRAATLLPVAVTPDRVTFRYDGLDGVRRTHVCVLAAGGRGRRGRPRCRADAARHRGRRSGCAGASRSQPGERARAALDGLGRHGRPCRRTPRGDEPGRARRSSRSRRASRATRAPAAYHAWDRGTTTRRQRPRAVQPRDRALARRPAAAGERRPGPGPALRRGRRAVVRDAVRPRLRSSPSLQSLAFRPQVAIETLAVLAAYQATEVDDWRDAEPGKILHELRTGEMAGAGELPHTPYYGSVDSTPLWLILLGATFDWTGDRALARPALAERARRARLDRHVRRPRRRRVRRVRAARPTRGLLNQGWKDSGDAIRDRTGREADAADRAGRGPGLRLRRQAADGRPGRASAATTSWPTRLEAEAERPPAPLRGPRSGSRTSATTRWPSTARSARPTRSARTPATACGRGSSRRTGRATSPTGCSAPAMFSGWGIRTYAAGPARLQPDRLPHRARSGRTTRR